MINSSVIISSLTASNWIDFHDILPWPLLNYLSKRTKDLTPGCVLAAQSACHVTKKKNPVIQVMVMALFQFLEDVSPLIQQASSVAGIAENYNEHHILVHFKPTNTLRQKLVHPEDKPLRHLSKVVYVVQCSQDCTDLYTGETKHKTQNRRANSSGQDSALHLHLNEKNNSFEDTNVKILAGEYRWFDRGVKESIYVKLEQPSLNRGGGLRHYLSPIYKAVLSSLHRQLKNIHT